MRRLPVDGSWVQIWSGELESFTLLPTCCMAQYNQPSFVQKRGPTDYFHRCSMQATQITALLLISHLAGIRFITTKNTSRELKPRDHQRTLTAIMHSHFPREGNTSGCSDQSTTVTAQIESYCQSCTKGCIGPWICYA